MWNKPATNQTKAYIYVSLVNLVYYDMGNSS